MENADLWMEHNKWVLRREADKAAPTRADVRFTQIVFCVPLLPPDAHKQHREEHRACLCVSVRASIHNCLKLVAIFQLKVDGQEANNTVQSTQPNLILPSC